MDEEALDLVVVGSGLYGIAAARTYLELHPDCNLRVLEADDGVGGVWSKKRVYPGFWSQTGVRIGGFPDLPFAVPPEVENENDLFEARYLAQYLEDYVDSHVYNGRSMRENFVFKCQVDGILKRGDVWKISVHEAGQQKVYQSRKLIIATGNHSIPFTPTLSGSDRFRGRIIHQRDLGESKALEDPSTTNIAVVGAGKSAADIAYNAAKLNKHVSWIIRQGGAGPGLFLSIKPPKGFTRYGYRNSPEIGSTRLAGYLGPNPFLADGWMCWFLHRTWLGEHVLRHFWEGPLKENKAQAEFRTREGALEGFEGLESGGTMRYATVPLGLVQQEDFWDTIARSVKVSRSDISHLNETSVCLQNGAVVLADAIVCGTGWIQSRKYFATAEASRLGLPQPFDEVSDEYRAEWQALDAEGEEHVLGRFPQLAHTNPVPRMETPYRLYNNIAPLTDSSIAFVGCIHVQNTFYTSSVQALWAAAYLDGLIDLPSLDERKRDVAFLTEWSIRRYPTMGQSGNHFDYEMASYCDRLLAQLGLQGHRTKGWWSDLVEPCYPGNCSGLLDEWKEKLSMRSRLDKKDL